jgi:DNA repair protein RadC
MQRLKPGVDIVLDILIAVAEAQPQSEFAQSLLRQYQERGGLSKKQLQGLYGKALKVASVPPGKLATLEAIILRKHAKNRSELPETKPLYEKDTATGQLIESILKQFPAHKRVLYLKSKYDNNEVLTIAEIEELKKFSKLLK